MYMRHMLCFNSTFGAVVIHIVVQTTREGYKTEQNYKDDK